MRRPNGGGRRGGSDDGRSFLEYLALGVLAAIILSGLTATGLSARLTGGVTSTVCHITGGRDCDKPTNGKSAQAGANDGHPSGDEHGKSDGKGDGGKDGGKGDGKKDGGDCHGVLGCAWHYVKRYYGGFYSAAGDEVKGIWDHGVDMFHDPWGTTKATWAGLIAPWKNNFVRAYHRWQKGEHVKAIGMLFVENVTMPYVVVYHTVVDDGVRKDWHNGDYAHMAGRLAWNVGTWFLPGFDELKGASVGSKIAGGVERHAGEEAGEKAGSKAGKKAGKDAGKDKSKAKKKVAACGAPAAYTGRTGVPVVRADLRGPAGALAVPSASPATFAKPGGCDKQIAGKTLSKSRLKHIWDRHVAKNKYGKKSKFHTTKQPKLLDLIQKTIERGKRTVSKDGKTEEYVYDTGHTVGTDKNGKPTTKVKVVVRKGQIITAYPVD